MLQHISHRIWWRLGASEDTRGRAVRPFYCEAMILSLEGVGLERKWMGDTGSSHHLKGDEVSMLDIHDCPEGMEINQVKGVVKVRQWGSVLWEVDGERGKHVIKLSETLIVPGIKVNLFSL